LDNVPQTGPVEKQHRLFLPNDARANAARQCSLRGYATGDA
jgi:hypothetical protein